MKKNSTLKWGLIIMAALLTRIAVFTAYAQVDPIKFNLTTTATAIALNEEIELKITARYVSISPNQAYVFQGANTFKVKMVFPMDSNKPEVLTMITLAGNYQLPNLHYRIQ